MVTKAQKFLGILALLVLTFTADGNGRNLPSARPQPGSPSTAAVYCNTYHNVGRMALSVSNDGTFASGSTGLAVSSGRDFFTGDELPTCEFPKGSRTSYCFGADIWIGAVLGRDTLVSTGADGWAVPGNEFHPDDRAMIYRSTIDPARPEVFEGAVSEQDYVCWYYDTCRSCTGVSPDEVDGRAHAPLNIEVTQRTYSWSYSYAQDFVLFDYGIKNIGSARLRRVYMGVYVDADIHDQALDGNEGAQDDFCGFRRTQPALYLAKKPNCPQDIDTVNIAWTADNDGDLAQSTYTKVPHISATRIIRTPSDSLNVSFNWWVSNGDNPALDFGPQGRATYRDYTTGGTGTPIGDRNKYHVLTNGEFDYDQPRIATIGPLDSIWLEPPPTKDTLAKGLDTRYVLSFGPFDIEPGQTLPLTLAYVAGLDFHRTADNLNNLPNNPDSWYQGVQFDSLGSNATWAEWIYDNPGVDTDSDGYFGTFTVCRVSGDSVEVCDTTIDSSVVPPDTSIACRWDYDVADTVWRKGDGVPDFQGASPPPSPSTYTLVVGGKRTKGLRVEPTVGKIRVIWNGVLSENTEDVFSREIDFEGYRVWIALDARRASYKLAASYDIEDFNRYENVFGTGEYKLLVSPFSLRDLRCLYAPNGCDDETWHPLDYPRNSPLLVSPTEIYYFLPQDFNRSILGNFPNAQTEIKKVYPDAPRPPVLDPDSIRVLFPPPADTLYLTPEGFVKAYEYEYTFDNLLPTVEYYINVTAFDYGSPQSGLAALETSPTVGSIATYALESVEAVAANDSKVFVYPNPYRLDGAYRELGFEARETPDLPEDRTRVIHFANLPAVCTIRIYTLDGDLVREIEHNVPTTDPEANHDTWDMITRNSQLVVSGLYYWSVEDDSGKTQIGKLVIIM